MKPGYPPRGPPVLATAAVTLGVLAALLLIGLDRVPPVHQDEPWIASAAAQLATTGTLGTPLFTGFYGAERHAMMFPPLLPVLEAAAFGTAGIGVATMRWPGVLAALVIALAVILVAARAAGPACAALAAALLVVLAPAGRWNGTSGVPLLDIARVARYDILVPAFGLLGLLIFLRARSAGRFVESRTVLRERALLLASGACTGIATLAHLYGAFWLAGLLLVIVLQQDPGRARASAAAWLSAGFVLALTPAILLVAPVWTDFAGQQQILQERYRLFDPGFYLSNLFGEPRRYRPLLMHGDPLRGLFAQPGLWIVLAGTPAALLHIARRRDRAGGMFAAAVLLCVQAALLALLVRVKTPSYLITLWPLAALLIAFGTVHLWQRSRRRSRVLLAIVFAAGFMEGGISLSRWLERMPETTRYADFGSRIAAHVPAGAHVLGLHQWWLALRETPYTSWLLPVWQNDARFTRPPVPFDRALDAIDPDVILLDDAMAAYFEEIASSAHPDHARYTAWRRWAGARGLTRTARIEDPTYGAIEVWQVGRQGPAP